MGGGHQRDLPTLRIADAPVDVTNGTSLSSESSRWARPAGAHDSQVTVSFLKLVPFVWRTRARKIGSTKRQSCGRPRHSRPRAGPLAAGRIAGQPLAHM